MDARDDKAMTPLLQAAKTIKTMFPVIQLLHERGADITAVNNDGDNALHLAAQARCSVSEAPRFTIHDCIRCLIENGADLEARDNFGGTPLILAIRSNFGDLDVVEALRQNGADVTARLARNGTTKFNGTTVLHCAYRSGFKSSLGEVLLKYGADPFAVNDEGKTPADHIPKPDPAPSGRGRGRGRGGYMAPAN